MRPPVHDSPTAICLSPSSAETCSSIVVPSVEYRYWPWRSPITLASASYALLVAGS